MSSPWVLVSGDFVTRGGQDRANYELACQLLSRGIQVHLVGHRVDTALATHPLAQVHPVPRPLGADLLGQPVLDAFGRKVAAQVTRSFPGAHVIVNGGNCVWPDINWVHSVHACWPVRDEGAPLGVRLKNRASKAWARSFERKSLRSARIILANSQKTRDDLVNALGLLEHKIHIVPLGIDADACKPPTESERRAARHRLRLEGWDPIILFAGALGYDRNKGLDTLLRAWAKWCRTKEFRGILLVTGGGQMQPWQRMARDLGVAERVRWIEPPKDLLELQAAADVAVCPSRYESFGLFAFESLCRALPVLVSASAGVAEHYPPDMNDLLIQNPESADEVAARLLRWLDARHSYGQQAHALSPQLRRYTWKRMAEQIIEVAQEGRGNA